MRSKTFLTAVNIQELTFAASTDDSSRTTPNPEKGSKIKINFKKNPNEKVIYQKEIDCNTQEITFFIDDILQANGESPLISKEQYQKEIDKIKECFSNAITVYNIGFGSKKALEYFLNNYNRIRAKQIFEQLENRKDNPVASIYNLFLEFDREFKNNLDRTDLWTDDPRESVKNFAKFCENKLKNARTTDKENLIEMIYIQGNEDIMDFKIGKYPVTQKQWVNIMDNNPSYFKNDNCPVENVSWKDVQDFIKKLNAKTGKKYRLPTEEEWEFAARGGNQSKGYEYSGSNNIREVAWYDGNSGEKTHPVGALKPNELGLYDMSGNVWEWCQDIYKPYLDDSKNTSDDWSRVLRGGSWFGSYYFCRVAFRVRYNPYLRSNSVGFRLAQSI